MFPVKGNTVWVNFREKTYLGKVLQTSPELDMVCVRISNYLDHVSRNSDQTDFVAHSCPESNFSLLSDRNSSVVVTCGFADICPIDSNNAPHFSKYRVESDVGDSVIHSENLVGSDSVEIPLETGSEEMIPDDSLRNRCNPFISQKNHCNWEESFGISRLFRNPDTEDKKELSMKEQTWQCWHCQVSLPNENDMNSHVINFHKLETLINKENWVVIGGIKGLDYDEIKAQEDTNINSLDNIHISTSSRKRQFLDSASELNNSLSNSFEWQNNSYHNSVCGLLGYESSSVQSEFENSLNELKVQDMSWNRFNEMINNNINLEQSNTSFNQMHFNDFHNLPNNQIGYENKMQIFQNIIIQHHINSAFSASLNNSLYNDKWSGRFRSSSIPDQLISELNQNHSNKAVEVPQTDHTILTPSKKSRLKTGVKKCRKMYGIDQRHLWCNQCKWKKACSRFSSDVNFN